MASRVEWWMSLKNNTDRLLAGLFMLALAEFGGLVFMGRKLLEKNEQESAAVILLRKERDDARLDAQTARVEGKEALLLVIQKHAEDLRSDNAKLENINEERTKALIETQNNSTNIKRNVKKLKQVN